MKLFKSVLVALHWKKKSLSLPFSFSEWSISSLQWDGKGAATGAGRRRGQSGVLHHQPQRSSWQGWLPEHYSDGIRVWSRFPSCLGIYLSWHLKPLILPASSDFSLTSSAAMKKSFWVGKVRGEREEKGPGRAWGGFPVPLNHGAEIRYPGCCSPAIPASASVPPHTAGTVSLSVRAGARLTEELCSGLGGFQCGYSCRCSCICSSKGLMQKGQDTGRSRPNPAASRTAHPHRCR